MAQADLRGEFQWLFVVAWTCASLALFGASLVLAKSLLRLNFPSSVVFSTAAIYGNTGYLGLPFVIIAFGDVAGIPIVVCTTVDLAVMLPLASLLLERSRHESSPSALRLARDALKSIVSNPLIVAVALGAAFSLSGLALPDTAERFVELLGSAAAPCALFALGSSLVEDSFSAYKSQTAVISFLKLVVHPILAWLAMYQLFPVSTTWAQSAVIAAAMPVAVTVYVLSQQFGIYTGRSSASILISTVISVATLSVILSAIT